MNKSAAEVFSEKITASAMQGVNEMTQSGTRSRDAAHEAKEKTTDQFDMMANRVKNRFRNVADQAERFAEQGRDAGERVQEVAGNFKGAVDRSVKHQPMATLAMAAVVGFVLGALWKS
jgi:ElaB/YqjD/DUF883 family membrane-anchored ribosome-binding protein